jgi:hypothetical protein
MAPPSQAERCPPNRVNSSSASPLLRSDGPDFAKLEVNK